MIDPVSLTSLAHASVAMSQHRTQPEVLQEIVAQAAIVLPSFEHVSLTLVSDDLRFETLAATTELARAIDRVQSQAKDGPCADAARLDEVMVLTDARHEQRWPDYIGPALRLGLRSQLSVRLSRGLRSVLCLSLRSSADQEITAVTVAVAVHFSVHAGLALEHVEAADQLHAAVGTRTVIGTAIGIVMERYGLGQDQAFSYLVRQASQQNRKLRLIAQDLVRATDSRVELPPQA